MQTKSSPQPETFETHLLQSARHVRATMADALHDLGTDVTKPQSMARELGLDKNLAWKVSRIVTGDDLLEAISHIPGRSGMQILLRALARTGAKPDALQSIRQALEDLDEVIKTHCGDRNTLEIMLGQLGRDNQASLDEANRKRAFLGNSAIWGVQTRVRLSMHFMAPARESSDMADLAVVSGLLDFRRLRSDVPWAVASVRYYRDDGTPEHARGFEPIDPSTKPDETPVIREFCSDPPPPLRISRTANGITQYQIAEGPVGNTAACTCVTGWICRASAPIHRTPHDRYGEHFVSLNTPAELSLHDLFVHSSLMHNMPPTMHLYSQMPGGPIYPADRNSGQLPLREPLIELGANPPDLIATEVPNYRKLVAYVIDRMGYALDDFAGYRMKLRFPPIPTALIFRHELPRRV